MPRALRAFRAFRERGSLDAERGTLRPVRGTSKADRGRTDFDRDTSLIERGKTDAERGSFAAFKSPSRRGGFPCVPSAAVLRRSAAVLRRSKPILRRGTFAVTFARQNGCRARQFCGVPIPRAARRFCGGL